MKIFILILSYIIFFCCNIFAGTRIYYDAAQNLEVHDTSGEKSLIRINEEFKGNFVDITGEIKAKENVIKENRESNRERKKQEIEQKKERIKSKLGLTDNYINDIKEILK